MRGLLGSEEENTAATWLAIRDALLHKKGLTVRALAGRFERERSSGELASFNRDTITLPVIRRWYTNISSALERRTWYITVGHADLRNTNVCPCPYVTVMITINLSHTFRVSVSFPR